MKLMSAFDGEALATAEAGEPMVLLWHASCTKRFQVSKAACKAKHHGLCNMLHMAGLRQSPRYCSFGYCKGCREPLGLVPYLSPNRCCYTARLQCTICQQSAFTVVWRLLLTHQAGQCKPICLGCRPLSLCQTGMSSSFDVLHLQFACVCRAL